MRQNVPQIQIHDGRVEQKAVEQVQDAADAGQKVARIFRAALALEQGLNQITKDRGDAQDQAQHDGVMRVHARHVAAEKMHEHQTCAG